MNLILQLYYNLIIQNSYNYIIVCNEIIQIAGKQAGYRAMTEFYQSLVCKNNKSIGEEIARLEVNLKS